MNNAFQGAIGNLKPLMDKLKGSEEHEWSDYRLAPEKGVYVFYKNGDPIYVGRSNNVRERIRKHGADSSDRHSATFAFKLLREALSQTGGQDRRHREGPH